MDILLLLNISPRKKERKGIGEKRKGWKKGGGGRGRGREGGRERENENQI